MNDEIKEIIDKIQNVVEHKEASYNGLVETKAEDYKHLLDYITNLQQEKEDYKSRVDNLNNAIRELEKKLCSTWQIYYDHYRLRDFKCDDMLDLIEQITNDITKLKEKYNILQNGSDDNE